MSDVAPRAPVTEDPLVESTLLEGRYSNAQLGESLLRPVLGAPGWGWWALVGLCSALVVLLVVAIGVTLFVGVGSWGNNIPVAWAFGIINFVWWIGIGHAGTLISAILLLFGEKWRSSVNRMAEAMTLFAVACAGLFPLLHLGRPWKFYYLVPYPSALRMWPQFRSPLTWDIVAILTYLTVSVLFWYMGLLPDLATARDTAKETWKRRAWGLLSLGWRGSARHWRNWRTGYLLLAGLATPLVVSVHTIVSFDFAVAQLPGWHTTIFPPYFVAGAIFSGLAMVMTLLLPARRVLRLQHVITDAHLDVLARLLLVSGLFVAYGYIQEHFFGWYSGDPYEMHAMSILRTGPYAPAFWTVFTCNVLVPQLFWSRRLRTSPAVLWVAALIVNVGMWLERFVIVVSPLSEDFLPSSWRHYAPTWVDLSLLSGTVGLFGLGFLLFLKLLPPVPISEVKQLQDELEASERFARDVVAKARAPGGGA
ncbi:polysulfide reductase NrfD [Myxococcus stipitatus]|uniref:NrfD/PsrC family molybdoenzyme membrane anchor subunit n=1 Tax=Myxococcus stipitatus TaxID=83455 RepID=UPI001F2D2A15|nr:NrfD/PsrC family molybdoenzyme membrane anchor subunit [Myxococcus stipitatus]MCE9670224.1 polysulfide reductase NrfD [Myxococcus stipitatus]